MRTIMSVLLFLCIVSFATTATAAYKDVPASHWGASTAKWSVEQGYMAAYDGYFSPNKQIPRIDAIVALAAMKGIKDEPTTEVLQFEDLSPTHKGYGVVVQLVKLGVIKEQQYFNPQQPITRAQMTKILAILFQLNVDMKNASKFSDVPAAYWANTYIESLADIGIINNSQTRFYPHRALTKLQLAAFMERTMRFQAQIANREVIYDYLQKKYIFTFQYNDSWVKSVIDLVNVERKKVNLPPLVSDPALSQVALIKAIDMVERNYFEHVSPIYGEFQELPTLFNYRYLAYGENLAHLYTKPEDAVKGWMKSPIHRENIVDPKFTHTGVGVQQAKDGSLYWVQHFAKK